MPCYYTGSAEGDARLAASEANSALTETTRLLCMACERMAEHKTPMPLRLRQWWAEHQKVDAARKAKS